MKQQGEVFSFKTGEGEGQRMYTYPLQEVKDLAQQLGMDLDVDRDYLWFLKEALVTILPLGWRKEANTTGLAQYHNTLTGVTTETHPLLFIFRSAYSHLLEMHFNQRADPTSPQDKGQSSRQRRLEPDQMIFLQSAEDQQQFFSELLKKIEKKQEGMKDTAKFEAAMKEVDMFYSALIVGGKVPRSIEDTLEYQCVDPRKMMEIAKMLGVQDDYRLFWVARLYAVLPLPPLWKRTYDTFRNEVFLNARYNITLRYHPSKNFFYKLIQTLHFGTLQNTLPVMSFLDKKLRVYEVDLLRLSLGQEYVIRVNEQPALHFHRESKIFRGRATGLEALDDVMALELAEGAGVELATEMHLMGIVYHFFDTMKSHLNGWEFRYTVQGEKYWYHSATQRAAKTYPFKHKLKATVDQARTAYYRSLQEVVKEKEEIHPAFRALKRDSLPRIREEAAQLMATHIGNHIKNGKTEIQDASAVVKLLPFQPATSTELMDVLFACPFRLEDDITIFEPNLDINIDDELVDVIEKDEVNTVLEDLKRQEASKPKPKPKLHGLMAKPHAVTSVSHEIETEGVRAEELVGGKGPAGKNIKELVTERALEAVHRLREAHNVSIAEEDSKADITSEENSLVSPPRPPVVQFAPLPIRPDSQLMGNVSPFSKSPTRKSLVFPENPVIEESPKQSTRKSIDMPARSPSQSVPAKPAENYFTSKPFKIAFARSPNFKKTLLRGERLQTSKTQNLEATTKPARTQKREDSRKSAINPGFELNQRPGRPRELSIGSDKPETGGESTGSNKKEEQWPAGLPLKSQSEDFLTEVTAEKAAGPPFPSENTEKQKESMLELEENTENLQETLKLLLAESLFKQRRGSMMNLLAETGSIQEEDISESQVDYQGLLASLMQDHPDLLTSGQAEEQLERLLEQAVSPPGRRKLNGRTMSDIEGKGLESAYGSTAATRLSSKTLGNLRFSATPTASRGVSNMLSTVASPTSSRNMSITDRAAITAHDDRQGKRILPALEIPRFSSEIEPPRAATEMRFTHSKHQFGAFHSYEGYQPSQSRALPSHEFPALRTSSSAMSTPYAHTRLSRRSAAAEVNCSPEDSLKHYVSVLGSPFHAYDISTFTTVPGLLPSDIVKMGQRLGIRVSDQPYESVESDLLWVGYFQVLAPLPPAFPVNSIEEILALPVGRHPGDTYFKLMLEHQRLKRKKELRAMVASKRVKSMVDQSWLRLRGKAGKCYRYNFLTGEEGPDSTLEFVRFKPQPVIHRRTVSLALPLPKAKVVQRVR